MEKKRYNDYGSWLRRRFPFRVQKLMVDAGFSCPNRDGTKGTGGCVFCDYLAYFQAYTNTYSHLESLRRKYEEALEVDGVVGIVVGTRPDCVSTEVLDYLQQLSRQVFVLVEYGVESTNDLTLSAIHRGHDFACSQRAIGLTASRAIPVGAHVILGLPGEDAAESLRQASVISSLPLHVLKIHHLQVLRGTPLARMYESSPFPLYSVDAYVALLAQYVARLRGDLLLERFANVSPPDMVVAPRWGIKGSELTRRLDDYMAAHDLWQGRWSE